MAEGTKTASAGASAGEARNGAGFELRLEKGGVSVRLADQPILPGLRLDALVLAVPDVRFPFDVGQGAGQFRHRLSELVRLEVVADASLLEAALAGLDLAAIGIEDARAALRAGFAEVAGRIAGGPAFTLKAGLLPAGDAGAAIAFHSPRIYGPAPLPAASLPHLAARAAERAGAPAEPLAPLLRRILAPRAWKLPRSPQVRLARADVQPGGARLAWDRDPSGPAVLSADPDLLAADEGARAFAEAEALLAAGEPARARDAYLAARGAASHPFGAERLLSLLCLEDRFHDEALDLAHEWLGRRPDFAPALAAEAWVRIARGEDARASRALAALAEGAAARGEGLAAIAAADAVLALAGAERDARTKAVEAALAIRRDHVPALRALRALASDAGDREALLRANRRLVAYAQGDAEKARAHAELGELLLASDPAAGRLHLDQALRLAPEDADALAALARACDAAGEHLRAARARERLKDVRLAAGDVAGAACAALEAGEGWDERLGHRENALLRYREACELAPGDPAPHARAAAAAEALGQWVEAADHHAAVLAALDASTPDGRDLAARTHVALADVAERRLADPAGAAAHLEAAAALAPGRALLARLAGLYRLLARPADLLAAIDRLAPAVDAPSDRAALLAEAGGLALGLGRPDAARSRFAAALALEPSSRIAVEGLARLAAERGDAQAERDALARLVPLARDGAEQAELLDRLAAACERAGELAAAARAVAQARRAEPSLGRLGEAIRLARRSADVALPALLAEQAAEARAAGDPGRATAALVERARLLAAPDPAAALAALAEARSLAPGDPSVLRAQADLAERAGDPLLALGCVRALLAGAPADAAALELRAARAALAGGEPTAAREHAERAVALGVAGAEEVLADVLERTGDDAGRAEMLERLGRHAEAAALWERAGDAPRARAALELAAEDPLLALDALPRLAELRAQAGDATGAADALLRLARLTGGREGAVLAMRAHALVPSDDALAAAVACAPDLAVARAARAERRADEDPRGALDDAEAALAGEGLPPDRRLALVRLAARLAAAAGAEAAARRHLEAYCAEVPSDDAALAALADLQRAAGAGDDLAATLERRLPLAAPEAALALRLELASLHAARGRAADAARLLREAIALDPYAVAPLRALLAPGLADALPPAERRGLLGRLADHPGATPEEAAAALGERARLLAREGDAAAALDALREAARRGRESDAALELRAELAAAAGEPVEAARARLARAERARVRGDEDAAPRLVEAGLLAVEAGLAGEAEPALSAAATLPLDRDDARAVLGALAAIAAARGDEAAERAALARLVPLAPTGDRPARLLRLAALALDAGDVPAARAAADEARALAPRDPAAAEVARAAALAAGDLPAVADRLADLAVLAPATAGVRLLERARLLASLARFEDADDAYAAAAAALPPERSLADEHARLRRTRIPARSAAEPLERFAARAPDPAAAADALRAAAALALERDDRGAALRCGRKAWARTRATPAFIAPLLARLVYEDGALAEALVLHREAFEAGLGELGPDDAVAICRQLSELAEDAGERDLALAALDRLLELKPQDLDAAERRFALDPDRDGAVRRLADAADATRSARRRALALARAAGAAAVELSDDALAEKLHRRALDAATSPRVAAEVERARADALAVEAPGSAPALAALRDAADAAARAGDVPGARALLAEAVALARSRDLPADAARDLLRLEALAEGDGDAGAAAAHARDAGALLLAAGDAGGAARALRSAAFRAPGDDRAWALLERAAHALGAGGGELLAEAAAARARLALGRARSEPDPAARVALLRAAAEALSAAPEAADRALADEAWLELAALDPEDLAAARAAAGFLLASGRREEAVPHLAALVRADPDDEASARELAAAYAGRHRDRAELFLARAAHAAGAARAQRLREAAKALFAAGDDARAREVQRDAFDASPADDPAFFAAIRDAAADVDRLDAVLSARAAAVPAEAAGCHHARADALAAFGRLDRALDAYAAAVALAPEDAGALASLAACLAQARGDEAAADVDARIRSLAGRDGVPAAVEAQSRYRLGLVAWAQGRAADAVPELERALALAPEDARAGLAWAALAHGRAARGDAAGALEAARRRADRAAALGLAEERRVALEAGAELAAHLGDAGPDAAALLEALLALRADAGADAAALEPLARRAADALRAAGAADRADATLARAGLAPARTEEPPEQLDVPALEAVLAGGPSSVGFGEAAAALVRHHEARGDLRAAARVHALLAEAAFTPAGRAAAFIASADALGRAGAAPGEIRDALDLAAAADPEGAEPWRARAAAETRLGDRVAAARAHLAVSIRTEEDEAARAALDAARLFEAEGRHADAARAYRAAILARPGCVPARRVLAEEALAAGDPSAAADHLAAVEDDALPAEARSEHARVLARTLEAAGRSGEAESAWARIFELEPADAGAFSHLAALALARGGLDAWLDLAARHDAALAACGDGLRRRELRTERGRLFAERGRLEEARSAYLAALELDPSHAPTAEALAALDARSADWAAAATALAAEAESASDRAEAAALHLRRARILRERLGDRDGAAAALDEALVRARLSDAPAAHRIAQEAEALLAELGAAPPADAAPATAAAEDPVAAVLREQAAAAGPAERPELYERLAGHLERTGDPGGAADALLGALEADPGRELTWSWLLALAEHDPARLERARELRVRTGLPPLEVAPPRSGAHDAEHVSFGDASARISFADDAAATSFDAAHAEASAVGAEDAAVPPGAPSPDAPAAEPPAPRDDEAAFSFAEGPSADADGDWDAPPGAEHEEVSFGEVPPPPVPDEDYEVSFSEPPPAPEAEPDADHEVSFGAAPAGPPPDAGADHEVSFSEPAAPEAEPDADHEVSFGAAPAEPLAAAEADHEISFGATEGAPGAETPAAAVEAPHEAWPEDRDPFAGDAGEGAVSFEPAGAPLDLLGDLPPDAPGFDASALEDLPPLDLFGPAEPIAGAVDGAPGAVGAPPTPEPAAAPPAERRTSTELRAAVAASFGAPAAEQAALRRELAAALEAEGDLDGAADALLGAHAAAPSDLATAEWLARVQERAGRSLEAIAAWEAAAELSLEGTARAARLAALGEQAEALAAGDRARSLFERAHALDPAHAPALAGLLRRTAADGDRPRVLELARALEAAAGPRALDPVSAPVGHALLDAGDAEGAHARLELALRQDPADLTVARDLSRAAERLGRHDQYVGLAEVCADAIAAYDPLAAAARYRQLSDVARDRLSDPERAAVLLEKALALVPEDADTRRALLELWGAHAATAPRAADAWLDLARREPSDGAALLALAELSRDLARGAPPDAAAPLEERARVAAALAAFASRGRAVPPPLRLARSVPPALRERVAAPGATGPLARLLQLLAPWLEPLFPADLARRGASPRDRVAGPRAPALHAALDGAAGALSARAHAAFLVDRPGFDLALENTRPPALVASAGVESLPPGALHFLAARTLDLLDRGWALAGKFAPNDVAILLELACRFAGGAPPATGLPAQRADPFVAALARSVPAATREAAGALAAPATEELGRTDPRAFTAALRRTANRVAVLYTGDPGGAIDALGRLDRRLEGGPDPAQALELPDLRDLALFALSDPFLELRAEVMRA